MKPSVERLRWGLIAAAALLLLMLVVFLGYGRYQQLKKWQTILAKLHLHGPHETTDFTYSSSPKGRTSYKVHAAKVIDHGDGKWSLYDVAVTLYGKNNGDEDHLYASDIEYNRKTGVAAAMGAVHIDLQPPGTLDKGKTPLHISNAGEESRGTIHVATSGLVYAQKLGVATTSQPVQFQYAGIECASKGAEFDTSSSRLHLLADVVMTGTVRNAPFTLHAVKADLDREANTITLVRPIAVSQGRTVYAGDTVLHLREDGSLQGAEGSDGVSFEDGTRRLVAGAYSGTFGATSLPLTAKLDGGVVATDTDASRPFHAQSDHVDVVFDAEGDPLKLGASGSAWMILSEHKPGSPDIVREIRGDRVVATFVKPAGRQSKSQLREVDATGSAMAREKSLVVASGVAQRGVKTTQVTAGNLRAVFAMDGARKPELRQMFGNDHPQLQQSAPMGESQTSSSDTLEITFDKVAGTNKEAPPVLQIASALQTGDVAIQSMDAAKPGAVPGPASYATATRALYDGATAKLTLTGGASFSQGQTSLTADSISVDQHTQDAEADGDVMASLVNSTSNKGKRPSITEQVTHIAARRALLHHASQRSEFFGTRLRLARLWEGASQIQAAELLFDQTKKSLLARSSSGTLIHAAFVSEPKYATRKPVAQQASQVVRITSKAMVYDDMDRQAVFTGGVSMDGTTAHAQSQTAVVFLAAAKTGTPQPESANPFGGSLRRIVLSEHVRIAQPGRTGTGEQLVYTAADGTYVLTGTPGKPPHIVDAQQGSITGAMLLFHAGDSTIIVTGATPKDKQGRVRTEVEVRGK